MSSNDSFVDLCLQGKAAADEIDDFVDRWHDAPDGRELHDFLGMTKAEYALWVRVPFSISFILQARRKAKPLADAVRDGCRALQLAGSPADLSTVARLEGWLKAQVD